jgi:hypothetical protein
VVNSLRSQHRPFGNGQRQQGQGCDAKMKRFAGIYGLDVKVVRGSIDVNWRMGDQQSLQIATNAAARTLVIMADDSALMTLADFLARVPALSGNIGFGYFHDGGWWVKFTIDTTHKFAWHVIQELGYVVNYLSLDERVPTVFMPVSPPPYLNGGPDGALSWVIECHDKKIRPGTFKKWVEGQLPNPVDDESSWGAG